MKKIDVKGPIISNDAAWIYNYFGWDCCSPGAISKGLQDAAGEDVVLEINSPGGMCTQASEMYKAVMDYPGKVTVHVITACSAATLLVCAADEALASDTAVFMIHNAHAVASGDYRDMQTGADMLNEVDQGFINAYVRKTGMDRERIQELMDKETYMSPKQAIEYGFLDGYLFGDPDLKDGDTQPEDLSAMNRIVAADAQIIPEDKAAELAAALKLLEKNGKPQSIGEQMRGQKAVLNITNIEGGDTNMTLKELLSEHPEVQAEVDTLAENAKAEGIETERRRMQSLDAIAATVPKDALDDAKYGDCPIDGPALAYKVMAADRTAAVAYIGNAVADSQDSGVENVGIGTPDVGEEAMNEAEDMAAFVNKTRRAK